IVFDDADLERALDAVIFMIYSINGERCTSSSRLLVQDTIKEDFEAALVERVNKIKVGHPLDPATEVGPLVTREHFDKVTGYFDIARADGATIAAGGGRMGEEGFFVKPTLFTDATNDMRCAREEIFGPVLSVVRAPDYGDAVRMINEHEYGNGVAIFTRDGDAARDFADCIEVGMVGVNVPIPVPVAYHSFGGWKRSLFGDHSIYGPEGVHFYTRLKTVTTRWPAGIKSGAQFTFPTL
ncbi:MAG TPA: methylmalonate-semialdehyde dehydrogenase (CoA acylating), partial [Pelagibacterium sp.]|nr:methylmalonate-semialdehyde dehydrogenase (CoA acylating) [Pelagibacterium sp.]